MLLNDKKGSGGCKKACANTTFEKVYTISPICLLALSTRGCRRVLLTTNGGTKKKTIRLISHTFFGAYTLFSL